MLKVLRGEGILPLLFTIDSTEGDTRAGRPRYVRPEGIRVYLGDKRA